jgi:hypothetical protein
MDSMASCTARLAKKLSAATNKASGFSRAKPAKAVSIASRIRSKGDRQLKEFVAAFAAILLLAASIYAQSLAKASNRAGGYQQIEQVAPGKIS